LLQTLSFVVERQIER